MKLYAVGIIEEQRKVRIDGEMTMLNLQWHDDMKGVIPVFTSKEEAENYAELWDSNPSVIDLEELTKENKWRK